MLICRNKTGSWLPLPQIRSGFAVHPFNPSVSRAASPSSHDGHPSKVDARTWDRVRDNRNPYEVQLEVGDEFFAFEEYVSTFEEDGQGDIWYRGYVSAHAHGQG